MGGSFRVAGIGTCRHARLHDRRAFSWGDAVIFYYTVSNTVTEGATCGCCKCQALPELPDDSAREAKELRELRRDASKPSLAHKRIRARARAPPSSHAPAFTGRARCQQRAAHASQPHTQPRRAFTKETEAAATAALIIDTGRGLWCLAANERTKQSTRKAHHRRGGFITSKKGRRPGA